MTFFQQAAGVFLQLLKHTFTGEAFRFNSSLCIGYVKENWIVLSDVYKVPEFARLLLLD